MPNRLAAWAIYDVFDTADADQIFVGVVSDGQWASFCAAFGLDDLANAPGLDSNRERVQRRDSYMPRVRALFQTRSRAEIAEVCEGIGLPFAPINRPQDMFDDPHLNHPGAMTPITLPDGRQVRSPSLPIEVDGERCVARHDVPRTGQHGPEVAQELGLSQAETEDLIQRGVIWRP
jgi:crotonobetainyl-CoA:carnitine CoA-transferase CaiB-like acyl-CoA transferase